MQQLFRRISIGFCFPSTTRARFISKAVRTKLRAQRYSVTTRATSYTSVSAVCAVILGTSTLTTLVIARSQVYAEAPAHNHLHIRLHEVRKHGRNAERKWVTRGARVYDITDWIPAHPGGDVILRAVGGAIDQYWDIFSVHRKQDVCDILESYFIGEIDPRDLENGVVPAKDIVDPFKADPERDTGLRVLSERPFNGETPPDKLENLITPNELFYVRNHMWVPQIDDSEHKVIVELYNGEEKVFTMADLKNFPQTKATVTLQCSGNRRQHMSEECMKASGLPWQIGGISTAEFTGVPPS